MLKALKYSIFCVMAGCLLLAEPLLAQDGVKGNLVTTKWLEKNLKNPDLPTRCHLISIQCSLQAAYPRSDRRVRHRRELSFWTAGNVRRGS